MIVVDDVKLIRVKKETWDRLGKQKKWPNRMNFNAVIEWMLNGVEKDGN